MSRTTPPLGSAISIHAGAGGALGAAVDGGDVSTTCTGRKRGSSDCAEAGSSRAACCVLEPDIPSFQLHQYSCCGLYP